MILNTTKKPRLRYRVIPGNMGNFGEPANSPNHKFVVVSGVDRGNGYQGASSVSHFLAAGFGPPEARQNLIRFLAVRGYNDWLAQQGIAVPASVKGRAPCQHLGDL